MNATAQSNQTLPYEARAIFGCIHNTTGEKIFVREGVRGFWPADGFDIDRFNTRQGWTAEEVESARFASVFGWDVPIARQAIAAIERECKREAVTTED